MKIDLHITVDSIEELRAVMRRIGAVDVVAAHAPPAPAEPASPPPAAVKRGKQKKDEPAPDPTPASSPAVAVTTAPAIPEPPAHAVAAPEGTAPATVETLVAPPSPVPAPPPVAAPASAPVVAFPAPPAVAGNGQRPPMANVEQFVAAFTELLKDTKRSDRMRTKLVELGFQKLRDVPVNRFGEVYDTLVQA